MIIIWYGVLFLIIYSLIIVSSVSIDSIYLNLIHRNISDYASLNDFYRNILQDVRNHRSIDTVYSPINVSKIRLNDYDENYLKTSVGVLTNDLHNYPNF
jgi:hypothetical protein